MPNVCVISYADRDIETIELAEWPEAEMTTRAKRVATLPETFRTRLITN